MNCELSSGSAGCQECGLKIRERKINMTKFESRIGKIQSSQKTAYDFLTNFNNFEQFIPDDKAKDWKSDENKCSFTVNGIGGVGLEIMEREPNKLIKITGSGIAKVEFYLWIQLKELEENDTRVRLTLKADLNPMIKMVASNPLKNFLEILVTKMEDFSFKEE